MTSYSGLSEPQIWANEWEMFGVLCVHMMDGHVPLKCIQVDEKFYIY